MAETRLEIRQFPCRSDNYGVILHDRGTGEIAAIDSPEANRVREELAQAGLKLTHIFTTHSHFDHIDGYEALKREFGCTIYGAAKDAGAIPGLDKPVRDGDRLAFGGFELQVMETPGHAPGHVVYYIADTGARTLGGNVVGAVFAGDVLFSVGCGRVADNAFAEMYASTQRVGNLPEDTLLYCGHEYTQSNVRFALAMEPGNAALQARKQEVDAARAEGKPTLPVTIGKERATNPFIRLHSPEIRQSLGLGADTPDVQVFTALRKRKDTF
jgi:hydroxyacylglutathione hydrolase